MAEAGGFLHAPDTYMEKIAVGNGLPEGVVDLDEKVEVNLRELAKAKGVEISDLVACVCLIGPGMMKLLLNAEKLAPELCSSVTVMSVA